MATKSTSQQSDQSRTPSSSTTTTTSTPSSTTTFTSPYATGLAHKQNIVLSNYAKGTFTSPQYQQPHLVHYQKMQDENTFHNRQLPSFRTSKIVTKDVLLHTLPALRDVTHQDRPSLLSRKIRLCCYLFTPYELINITPTIQRDRDLKKSTCQEIAQYIHTMKPNLSDDQLSELFEMFEINIFQPLPPVWIEFYDGNVQTDEEYTYLEETKWEHSQLIYDCILKMANLTETDPKLLQKYFSPSFVLGLLERFDSENTRERDYLKTILHRIYGNFMALRPFIRNAINHVFYRITYETDRFNGISELLEILGSIINGFALPLKEQHKIFLIRVLLPMHKISAIGHFLGQLTYCLTQFLDKDPSLASHIITAMVAFWPKLTSKKELLFLKELEDLIDKIQPRFLTDAAFTAIFTKLGECISSPHFQLAERSLMVLHSEGSFRLLAHNRALALPPIIESLHLNTYFPPGQTQLTRQSHVQLQFLDKQGPLWSAGASTRPYGHWSATISEVCADVLKKFIDMDVEKAHECTLKFENRLQVETTAIETRKIAWRNVYTQAVNSGLLEKYDYDEFRREQRQIAADPPILVKKEKKSNSPA